MQALGNSQIALQTQTGITTPTPTTTPGAGHEVEVGHQTAPQGAQVAKKYPKLQAQLHIGTITNSSILSKTDLLRALGTTPSTSAKAKTAFASAFNKVANVFGFKGVRKSDFVGITKAVKQYEKAKQDGAGTAELREKLVALKDKIASHQARHPGKLENLAEVGEFVDAEIEKLDLLIEIATVDESPKLDKTSDYSALLKKLVDYSLKNPSNLSKDEEKALHSSLTAKVLRGGGGEVQRPGGETHKVFMQCIQAEIRSHAQGSTDGTLLRGNGDVLLSKPHAYAVINDHLKEVVLTTIRDSSGGSFEVDPNKMTPEEHGERDARVARLGVCFESFCDRMGISSDPEVQDTGIKALPQELCDQARCLYEEVLAAGHNEAAARRAVTSLVMLKLVVPMLTTPQGSEFSPCELRGALEPQDQRNMMILSKVIQNLANGVQFREDFMTPFNHLLDARKDGWTSFVDGVVARGRDMDSL